MILGKKRLFSAVFPSDLSFREAGAGGSNPLTPTKKESANTIGLAGFFVPF
jgi:hypothetical protein